MKTSTNGARESRRKMPQLFERDGPLSQEVVLETSPVGLGLLPKKLSAASGRSVPSGGYCSTVGAN